MIDEYISPQFESFLVRFWQERASHVWRGKVIHVQSQEACDFVTLEQIESFIRRFVLMPPTGELPAATAADDLRRIVAERSE